MIYTAAAGFKWLKQCMLMGAQCNGCHCWLRLDCQGMQGPVLVPPGQPVDSALTLIQGMCQIAAAHIL